MLRRDVQGTVHHRLGDGNHSRWQLTLLRFKLVLLLFYYKRKWVGEPALSFTFVLTNSNAKKHAKKVSVQLLIREQVQRRRQQQQPQLQAHGQMVTLSIFKFVSASTSSRWSDGGFFIFVFFQAQPQAGGLVPFPYLRENRDLPPHLTYHQSVFASFKGLTNWDHLCLFKIFK